jgi:hypothetical protein
MAPMNGSAKNTESAYMRGGPVDDSIVIVTDTPLAYKHTVRTHDGDVLTLIYVRSIGESVDGRPVYDYDEQVMERGS